MNAAVEAGLSSISANYATAVETMSINGKSLTKSREYYTPATRRRRPCPPKFLDKMKQERYAIPNLKAHRGVRFSSEESTSPVSFAERDLSPKFF
jgi:hypothetical protein